MGVGAAAGDVVLAAVGPAHPGPVVPGGVRGEVGLHADDRLDPGGVGLPVEVVGAEDVAVVGHRQRRHAHLGGPLEQLAQPAAPSSIEYSVCTCRWTKESVLVTRPPSDHDCLLIITAGPAATRRSGSLFVSLKSDSPGRAAVRELCRSTDLGGLGWPDRWALSVACRSAWRAPWSARGSATRLDGFALPTGRNGLLGCDCQLAGRGDPLARWRIDADPGSDDPDGQRAVISSVPRLQIHRSRRIPCRISGMLTRRPLGGRIRSRVC